MQLQLSIYDILLIIGITQGVITSILLFASTKNVKSNRFLALGLIAFCFLSAKSLLLTLGLWNIPYIRYFPNAAETVVGPLFYFYLVHLLNPDYKLGRLSYLHFVPFLISQSLAFLIYFSTLRTTVLHEKDTIANSLYFNQIKLIDEYIAIGFFIFYIPVCLMLLRNYRQWVRDHISDTTVPDLSWLRNFYLLFLALGSFLIAGHVLEFFYDFGNRTQLHWQTINLLIAFMIYYLGFVGYKQPQFDPIHMETNQESPQNKQSEIKGRESEIAMQLKKILEEDRLFLNPTLSLKDVAEQLDLPQKEVSSAINKVFRRNFRDLINEYRVEEVKRNMESSQFQNLSLTGIAFESGFNSEASFYRIFRKRTGLSPKEYLKTHTQN